jgi:hypothetical protein
MTVRTSPECRQSRVAFYVRNHATDRGRDETTEEQLGRFRNDLNADDMPQPVAQFLDQDVPDVAPLAERRARGRTMEAARAGAFDVLLIRREDTISASLPERAGAVRAPNDLGIDVVWGSDLSGSPLAQLTITTVATVAQQEREAIRRRAEVSK